MTQHLSTELILYAYSIGAFPMADSREAGTIHWIEPKKRGIFPLDHFHVSKSLGRAIIRERFHVTLNTAFPDVIAACATRQELGSIMTSKHATPICFTLGLRPFHRGLGK